jgi:hypothetical protein
MPEEVSQVNTVPSPVNTAEALGMLRASMRFLATADATAMAAETQAQCLQALEQVNAIGTAARASILGAFTAGQGYSADADYSPRAWLIHHTRVTKGAAAGHTAWARRAKAHPEVAAALAEGEPSESFAREICRWTDKLPEECRDTADAILVGAARAGMDLAGLAELAGEMLARSQPDSSGDGPDDGFEDRSVRVETTFEGAGVISGNLTPECAAVVTAVLDALSAPVGAEDTRSHGQRYHDGLQEAMRRLLAGGMLPERAGQPLKAWVHVSLADLLVLDADSALQAEWTARVRAQWAAHRAAASVSGSDGAAWLDGNAVGAVACDALLTPVVTGEVNTAALDALVRLCVELARINDAQDSRGIGPLDGQTNSRNRHEATPGNGAGTVPEAPAGLGREALTQAIIGKAVELVSGPGGLASFLRRGLLGARLAGPSLPLDVGVSKDIPAAIRAAVILRDQHCRWAGGCDQPAAACEVHHVTHQAHGGKTSVKDCALFCFYHHHVAIHQLGWTVVLNPDGTTTAISPDKTKVLRSHSPPARAG